MDVIYFEGACLLDSYYYSSCFRSGLTATLCQALQASLQASLLNFSWTVKDSIWGSVHSTLFKPESLGFWNKLGQDSHQKTTPSHSDHFWSFLPKFIPFRPYEHDRPEIQPKPQIQRRRWQRGWVYHYGHVSWAPSTAQNRPWIYQNFHSTLWGVLQHSDSPGKATPIKG